MLPWLLHAALSLCLTRQVFVCRWLRRAVRYQCQCLPVLLQVLQQPSNLPRSSANIAVQASPMDIDVQCTASKSNAGDSATATDSRTQCHWETSGTAGPLANTSQEAEQAIAVK
jgi:hypothetical protein